MSAPADASSSARVIPLAQLESMLAGDGAGDLDAVMGSPTAAASGGLAPPALVPLNRPDNEWVRFEAQVRSKHALALMKLRRLWESGGIQEDVQPLLRLLEIEEYTRCQAFQGCVMGEERSHVYQAAVTSIIQKLVGKLESQGPTYYQNTMQCLSDYLSALNHHQEICVVPPPPSALPPIAEGSALGYATSQLTGYSSEESGARSETRSEAARSEDTLSVCSGNYSGRAEGPGGVGFFSADAAGAIVVDAGGRRYSGDAGVARSGDRAERRRESNKMAASRYRSKKRETMSTVVDENKALRQQVATLSSQSAVLAAENKLLHQQVAFLQKMLSGRGGGQEGAPGGGGATTEEQHIAMLLDSLDPAEAAEAAGFAPPAGGLEVTAQPEGFAGGQFLAQGGGGLPAEGRCAKAFGAATSADTDMLGFSAGY